MTEGKKQNLQQKLKNLPKRPGVYLLKDKGGNILYIGKAVDLRQRVRSYFQEGAAVSPKVKVLAEKVSDLDYTVTDNEVEALILESNLIKEHSPRYNIDLRDDKHYPYLRVTVQERFPRIHVARRVQNDGARYFGPYPNAGAVREIIRLIHRLFMLRMCRGAINSDKSKRPCLNYQIKRCLAPCAGLVSAEEYRRVVDEVLLFLEGRQEKLLQKLAARMEEAAANLEFEKAARLRDQYQAVQAIIEKQKIVATTGGDRDIVALAAGEDVGCVQLFTVRNGRLTGREHFILTNPTGESSTELLKAFLRRYYLLSADIPPEILLSEEIDEKELLSAWLKRRAGRKVRLHVPKRGEKKELVRLALENAQIFLEQEVREKEARDPAVALEALAAELHLVSPPLRMEGYDISHFQGEGTVAAMVVFEKGLPKPKDYRRFLVRGLERPDDYAAIREVVGRRFARLKKATEQEGTENSEDPFSLVPDLILIDGGRGQLNAALQSLQENGYDAAVTAVALAEEEELIYRPGVSEPLRLPRSSLALQLLQRIRDEAHRFALTSQRRQRTRPSRGSVLLDVPGIGAKRRKALLRAFGSIEAMRRASVDELAAVETMNRQAAINLYNYLQENGSSKQET